MFSMGELIASRRSELLAAYPEIEELLVGQSRGGCFSCSARKALSAVRALGKRVDGLIPDEVFKSVTVGDLKTGGRGAFMAGKPEAYSPDASDMDDEARVGCLDCVLKHLARALVLLEESELGYPQHRDLAIIQVEKALTHAPDDAELRKIAAAINSGGLFGAFAKAVGLIKTKLDSGKGGRWLWMAVGHLGEAEAEALLDNQILAEEIRQFRVALMGGVKLDMKALMDKLEMLRRRQRDLEAANMPKSEWNS
jgi:hypothetical protein